MNGLPYNGNYPPGVSDNHPYFNPPEVEYDIDELDAIGGALEDAMAAVEEAMYVLVREGYYTKDDEKELLEKIDGVKEELDYFNTQQKADW
mgnify:CR=1 FL=1